MIRCLLLPVIFLASGPAGVVSEGPTYDVLIRGGDVYIGDGSAPIDADVGVRGDTIALVGRTEAARAGKEIDARGLAVAPGFINMLSWSTESLIAEGKSDSEIRQGVTTQVFGEGQSMGPLNVAMKRRRRAQQTVVRFDYEWSTLAEYLQYLERRGVAPNVASFVGASTVREYVMGLADRPPSPSELEQMQRLVEREMKAGALGVGSALFYPPGSFAKTEELIALCQVAARYGGIYTSHIRNQGSEIVEAIEELIRISREAAVPAEIYHFGTAGEENWGKLDRCIEIIEAARRDGLHITANMHAYPAGCTGLTACLPPWVQEGGADALFKRLKDPAARRRIAREIRSGIKGWDNPYRTVGSPERILLLQFQTAALKPFQGKTLAEIAATRGQEPIEVLMDLILEDRTRVETVYFTDTEENVRRQIKLPWISFGSDAASMSTDGVFAGYGTHPRAFGNFARVLGKYVRDEGLVSWQEAIHRLTGMPATNLGLDRRGLLREGFFADIVVFDRKEIADQATFEKPQQYAVGVKHVFVNGVQVLDDGKHTGALPGRALHVSRRRAETDASVPPRTGHRWADSRLALSTLEPLVPTLRVGTHVLPLRGLRTVPGDESPGAGDAERRGLAFPRRAWEREPDWTTLTRRVSERDYSLPVETPIALLPQNAKVGSDDDAYRAARLEMVRESLERAEPPIKNPRVLDAMRTTPRHQFVPQPHRKYAYVDTVLPIGYEQTISPPYIVAYMTEKIDPQPDDRVFEIGTGSGYQAAVLSPLAKEVYTIEIVEPLGRRAAETLKRLGYDNVFVKIGDGYKGWPEKAPFNKIIVTCSPDHVPQPLIDQLAEGGTMIIPVGERYQQSFYLVQKRNGQLTRERLLGTFFVPMTGEAERQRRDNPDGTKPSITNGNFEMGTDVEGGPEHWYYQRGVSLETKDAPEGKHYVVYSNDKPGHLAHSNQGFAVDGRFVESLDLSYWIKTEAVLAGPKAEQLAGISITFFDRNRSFLTTWRTGPFPRTMPWTSKEERVAVPRTARDAVIMIGLNGATGKVALDDVRLAPVPR
ncbi:MAG: protein-L-isoaspartate(D-aspartate) O-methyltransferase, partial [Planctomycetes bacterium]|nr:protein-L-isoaspartate(D-aspartate) O-methyltransferase [Planctomycetota bacterium]